MGAIMGEDLAYASALDLLKWYQEGTVSPVDVTEAVLKQIETYNSALNAFVLVDEEYALAEARKSEDRWRSGKPKGLIDGVPCTVKDIILTKGWPTLRGSKSVDAAGPWEDDAPAVSRLKEQGGVIVGKTTTPEFGWKGVTDSPRTGITRNPWNPDMTPGGPSGGASSACAAGMGALHIGTDGGGSIRIPASFAGIFGIKPSFGRVPAWPLSPFGTVAHIGPMTRTVGEAALMLQVLSGADYRDWFSLPPEDIDYVAELSKTIKGKRIAYSPNLGYATVDPEVASAVKAAAELMEDLGAIVEEKDPGFENPLPIFNTLWFSGARFALRNFTDKQLAEIDPGLRAVFDAAENISLTDVMEANQARGELGITMRKFQEEYDFLMTPSLSIPAFEVGRLAPQDLEAAGAWVDWTPFSYPFNLTQQPACSIPCGLSSGGLPIGLQFVGRMQDDASVLIAANAYEGASPVAGARPDLSKLV
jgi:aspartyl-tRNA(Asn)/glutamyl-tRNA(Gln) amidotransferase subunit A